MIEKNSLRLKTENNITVLKSIYNDLVNISFSGLEDIISYIKKIYTYADLIIENFIDDHVISFDEDRKVLIQFFLGVEIATNHGFRFYYNQEQDMVYVFGSVQGTYKNIHFDGPLENHKGIKAHEQLLVDELNAWQQVFISKFLFVITERERTEKITTSYIKQQQFELGYSGEIVGLLSQSNNETNLKITFGEEQFKIATDQDFFDSIRSISEFTDFIYAENEKYLNNIILGFDPLTGKILTTEEKDSNFNRYFLGNFLDTGQQETFEDDLWGEEEKQEILEEIKNISSLPPIQRSQDRNVFDNNTGGSEKITPLSTDALGNLVRGLSNNVASILTPLEKIDHKRTNNTYLFNVLGQAHMQEHAKQRKESHAMTEWIDKQQIQEVYEASYLLLEEKTKKRLEENYILTIQGVSLNKEINDKIIHQFYTLESIFYHDEKDMCEKINKIRKDKGTQGEEFFAGLKQIHTKHKEFEVYLGKKYFGENFSGIPTPTVREQLSLNYSSYPGKESPEYLDRLFDPRSRYRKRELKDLYPHTPNIEEFIDIYTAWRKQNEKNKEIYHNNSISKIFSISIATIEQTLNTTFSTKTKQEKSTLLQETVTAWLKRWYMTYWCKGEENTKILVGGQSYSNITVMIYTIIKGFLDYCKTQGYSIDLSIILHDVQYAASEDELKTCWFFELLEILGNPLQIDTIYRTERIEKLRTGIYNRGDFDLLIIPRILQLEDIAYQYHLPIQRSSYPPLETFAIKRIRIPEPLAKKYSNELYYDRYSGITGYQPGDLADIEQLYKILAESGSSLDRQQILQLDYRSFANIDKTQRIDLQETVPVKSGMPFVQVLFYAFRTEKEQTQGRYTLIFDRTQKHFKLIFDNTVINSNHLLDRYNLYDQTIVLGGGRATVYREKQIVELSGRISTYDHEPRIITATALVNALGKHFLGTKRSVFLGDDGYVKQEDYM